MKKIILTVFAATSLLLYSTPSFALLSVSVGAPLSQTPEECEGCETDSLTGYFLGVQLPFALGLGIDSHKHKYKGDNEVTIATTMYNVYYQLPIPVINLIFGLGVGSQGIEGIGSESIEKGSANQWYTSIGFPIMPLFDIHLSYRSITSKEMKWKSSGEKIKNNATVMGAGFSIGF
jgi:hypothetical protein